MVVVASTGNTDNKSESLYAPAVFANNDDVKGYNLATIEDNMLHKIFTLQSLREQLKAHKPAGVTDADIDKLLLSY